MSLARDIALIKKMSGGGGSGGGDGTSISVDSTLSATSTNPVQNKIVTAALDNRVQAPATAAVGQTIRVSAVDDAGKPTAWEAVDLPSGGGIAVDGATVGQTVTISAVDENGVPTAWEAVDLPSGGSNFELIRVINVEEDWVGDWMYGTLDISAYKEIVIFLSQVIGNSDSASIAPLINGVLNSEYIPAKTTPTSGYYRAVEEGHVNIYYCYKNNYGSQSANSPMLSTPPTTVDWGQKGDELETLTLRMSASAWSMVSGTIEIYGVKR